MSDKKYKYIATFTTIVSLCLIGAIGYLYYLSYAANKKVVALAEDNQTVTNRLWTLERNFSQYRQSGVEKLDDFESSIKILSGKVTQLSSNRTQAIRYEVSYFINLASQSLLVYHDATACLQFLDYANNYLSLIDEPIFNKLKYAINHDITNLQQLPKIDKANLSAKLDSITQRINSLSFVNQEVGILPNIDETKTGLWGKFIYNLKNTLFSLVKISKTKESSGLLLPEEEYITRTQVRVELLNARLSLLSNDNTNWNASLVAAEQSIKNYFVSDATARVLITQIDELRKLNVDIQNINLDETMKALLQLNSLSGG